MERVKFYSKEDISSGPNLKKAEIIIYNFDNNKAYTNINEMIEFYNIYLYVKNEMFLKSWSDDYIEKVKNTAKQMKYIAYKWFSRNINNKTVISEYKKVKQNYKKDFFEIINNELNKINIDKTIFKELLEMCSTHLCDILQCKEIVDKYEEEIKERMLTDVENSTEIFVDIYLIKDSKKRLYLPKTLSITDKENIIINYVDSEKPNLNYLKLLLNTPNTTDFSLNDRIKLKIKNKIKEQENEIFTKNSNNYLSTKILVQIVPNLGEYKKEKITNRTWELSYDLNWIKENKDFSTLLNNYIYLFNYVDQQMRWTNVSKKANLSITDRFLTMHAKDEYIEGFAFKTMNYVADMQQVAYNGVLNKMGIRLEEIIEWFFNIYLKKEFNIEDYQVNMPSKDSTYLEKCCLILSEMEGALKKYNYYVEDGYIDHELVDISSKPISFYDIRSLLKNKYAYPNSKNDDYDFITFALFSDQCMLRYIERIGDKYNNFFELLKKEEITLDDIDEYDKSLFNKLLDYCLIYIDDNRIVKIKDIKAVQVLNDLYYNEVISYWKLSSDYRKTISDLKTKGLIEFESTLLSKQEADYLSYYLNRKKFNNSLDLRNKYTHGTKSSSDEIEHHKNYMIMLRLFILVIIKINDDLCIYDSDDYKNEQIQCI